jgi:hypothetical protein
MKSIFLISFLTVAVTAFGQIQRTNLPDLKKIGEVKYMGTFIAELSYTTIGGDTSYSLLFNNAKYSTITDLITIKFDSSPGILDTLYNILNTGFELANDKKSTFYLGKEFIAVNTEKSMGIKFIRILALDRKAYFYLRKKQLNELFGKTK